MPGRVGFPLPRLKELRVYYPTIKAVRNQTEGGHARMVYLEISDRKPISGRKSFRITIHFTGSMNTVPTAYVINGREKGHASVIHRGGSKLHDYDYSMRKIPGTNIDGYWICHGDFDLPYRLQPKDPVKRLLAFINHISSLLNA